MRSGSALGHAWLACQPKIGTLPSAPLFLALNTLSLFTGT